MAVLRERCRVCVSDSTLYDAYGDGDRAAISEEGAVGDSTAEHSIVLCSV